MMYTIITLGRGEIFPQIKQILFLGGELLKIQAWVVQRLDNAIHRINRYPVDKCWQNKPRYPLDSDLSSG